MLQARDGVMWAGTDHGLYRQDSGKFVEVIPALSVNRIAQASNGNLLLITGQGFIEWDGHQIIRHPGLAASLGVHDDQIFQVYQDRSGTMWYCTNVGVVRRGVTHPAPLQPSNVQTTAAFRIYQDFQGTVWVCQRYRNLPRRWRPVGDTCGRSSPTLLLCQPRWRVVDRHQRVWSGSSQTPGGADVHRSRRLAKRCFDGGSIWP